MLEFCLYQTGNRKEYVEISTNGFTTSNIRKKIERQDPSKSYGYYMIRIRRKLFFIRSILEQIFAADFRKHGRKQILLLFIKKFRSKLKNYGLVSLLPIL